MTDERPTHAHPEAFCVMEYRSKTGVSEWVWNSRDGVTPFIITLKNGEEATHVNWAGDDYCPNHYEHMGFGQRYFTDLDPEAYLALTEKRVEEWWDHPQYPMSKRWETKEEAVKVLMGEFQPGSPTIKTKEGPFVSVPAGTDRFA